MGSEFFVKLFKKSPEGLELTKEGELIYPSVQFILKQYDSLITSLGKYTTRKTSVINIATMFHQTRIIGLLNEFSEKYPDIELNITENNVSTISGLLNRENIDAAVIYENFLERTYRHTLPIRDDRLVAVVCGEHPLAERGCVSIAELRDENFFMFKDDEPMYQFQLHTCIQAGFAPRVSRHNLRLATITECVARNCGVSLLMENVARSLDNSGMRILELAERPALTMSMVFPSAYNPDSVARLISFVKSAAKTQSASVC
jgi:DNA-binding transcriptional LysR family regulator